MAEAWRDRRDDVVGQAGRISEAIERASRVVASEATLDDEVADDATHALRRSFDARWGGFGGAPKFPQPMTLEFLLRRAVRGSSGALEMVTTTLDRMAGGGIRDHVGGGFHGYSTDERWHVPHFEKMLYDNALLLQLYTRAWQVTGTPRYREVARHRRVPAPRDAARGGWILLPGRRLRKASRGSSYVDVAGAGGARRGPLARAFGARPEGNWEGTNVLWHPTSVAEAAASLGRTPEELDAEGSRTRSVLFEAREARIRPATDDKVLAAWNGMAIAALAEAEQGAGRAELRRGRGAGSHVRALPPPT